MHTCAQNCTTSRLVVHKCAQMCAELCANPFSSCRIVYAEVCRSVGTYAQCLHKFAQMCTNMQQCAQMCTSMHMCFCRIQCYLYSRDMLFFGSFLLHQGRFPPYGSAISESCGAISSVTERDPPMCTLVYTILPHLPKC